MRRSPRIGDRRPPGRRSGTGTPRASQLTRRGGPSAGTSILDAAVTTHRKKRAVIIVNLQGKFKLINTWYMHSGRPSKSKWRDSNKFFKSYARSAHCVPRNIIVAYVRGRNLNRDVTAGRTSINWKVRGFNSSSEGGNCQECTWRWIYDAWVYALRTGGIEVVSTEASRRRRKRGVVLPTKNRVIAKILRADVICCQAWQDLSAGPGSRGGLSSSLVDRGLTDSKIDVGGVPGSSNKPDLLGHPAGTQKQMQGGIIKRPNFFWHTGDYRHTSLILVRGGVPVSV